MRQQRIKTKPTTPVQGILMILGILVLLFAASIVSSVLVQVTRSRVPAAVVWLGTAALAIFLMRERVMEYGYTVANDRLYIERLYGQHGKILLDVALMDVVRLGDERELRAAYPDIRFTRRAWLKGCTIAKQAIVYKVDGAYEMAVIQPDAAMQKAIYDPEARQRAREERYGGRGGDA